MRQTGEPTVEEILDSIKQVIARDNRAGAAQERHRRETEGVVEDAPEDDAEAEVEVLDLSDTDEYLPEDDSEDFDSEAESDAPLTNEGVRTSMRESLAALAMLSEPGAPPQIVRSGETSLEGMVRDLLRPALAEWLDKNLPPLVERMVADEIRRISGRKG